MLDALIKIHGSRLAVVNFKEVFTKLFTDLPAELSFPLRYFEQQCEEDSKLREYVKVLEAVRTELFEIVHPGEEVCESNLNEANSFINTFLKHFIF